MGNERAVKAGKWINRPKTGYNLFGHVASMAAASQVSYETQEERARSDVEIRFEAVAAALRDLNIETV